MWPVHELPPITGDLHTHSDADNNLGSEYVNLKTLLCACRLQPVSEGRQQRLLWWYWVTSTTQTPVERKTSPPRLHTICFTQNVRLSWDRNRFQTVPTQRFT